MNKICIKYLKTSFGELILGSLEDKLCLCDWCYRKMRDTIDRRIKKSLHAEYIIQDSLIIQKAEIQLLEYFSGDRNFFDIPLLTVGSEFQNRVWNELLKIPYGKTETYLNLSKKLNNTDAIRAVASANGANALSIFIPCHRIIGSRGDLGGYAGGLTVKKHLLQLESSNKIYEQLQLLY